MRALHGHPTQRSPAESLAAHLGLSQQDAAKMLADALAAPLAQSARRPATQLLATRSKPHRLPGLSLPERLHSRGAAGRHT
ncbi:hypothetical protein IscW_ISCW008298 [Ixodes scapularis]|uniref:Uncharacterized protein n=1 Tax=Ixodes scapularis TaxID=6945 RepID=B7PSY4_IXOSC|nr:hypothetical protein IscW_ISCW008298 [Ixodes scapularis]|eukprot:XP_002403355.1 hypothetical protein IscW_ISCW008298 [Ixodes scapularis]